MDATVRALAEVKDAKLLLLGFQHEDTGKLEAIASDLDHQLLSICSLDDPLSLNECAYISALLIDVTSFDVDFLQILERIQNHRILRELPLLLFSDNPTLSPSVAMNTQAEYVDVILKSEPSRHLREKLDFFSRMAKQSMLLRQQAKQIDMLEAQVRDLKKMLARRDVRLRQASEEMNQFSYIASHDLREPLRMVSSFMELLNERYQVHLDEQARKFIFFAVDGAVRMQNLINGIVEFNHIRRSANTIALISVSMIVEAALINLSARLVESNAEVKRDELPEVYADRAQLTQVFECLLDNAIKFKSERPLKIQVSARKEEHFWVFSVLDNGIGFDETQSKRVFGLFQTLHEREKYHGHGTGLAFAKKIIESYGGEIWVASVSSEGSRFEFRWPIEEMAELV